MQGVHAAGGSDITVHEYSAGQAVLSVNSGAVDKLLTVLPFTGARVLQPPSPFYPIPK